MNINNINDHRDLLRETELSRKQIAELCKLDYPAVQQWEIRNRIPVKYWRYFIELAPERRRAALALRLVYLAD